MATVPIPLASGIAQMPPRKKTRGWAKIPNAVVENQAMFTHSELAFLLVMFRRNGGAECVISDRNWEHWTGLKDRQKHYAIAGLRQKGLEFEGKGDTSVYRFSWKVFHEFLRSAKPDDIRPKTKGRAVSAPRGLMVHPDCAEKGCSKLCEECDVQPVAQVVPISGAGKGGDSVQRVAQNGKRSSAGAAGSRSKNVQPVAQAAGGSAGSVVQPVAQFDKSFAWLRGKYATVGIDFVRGLANSVDPPCDDDELLQALQLATKKNQYSEGLYAGTVPAVVASMRLAARPKPVRRADVTAAIAGLHELVQRDTRFKVCVANVVEELRRLDVHITPEALSVKLEEIEAPLRKQALDLVRGDQKFTAAVERFNLAADKMGLKGTAKKAHVETLSLIEAQTMLDVPTIWGLLL